MALRVFGVGIAASAGFIFLEATHGRAVLPFLYYSATQESSLLGGAVPRAVGVPLLLTCLACFWLTLHGFTVGSLRTKYMELARKDGEKDVDARYSLPNLYVDGLSKHARAFNCAQRSHQQAFETLPQLLFFTLVASAAYPLAAAGNVALWLIGRVTWTRLRRLGRRPQKSLLAPAGVPHLRQLHGTVLCRRGGGGRNGGRVGRAARARRLAPRGSRRPLHSARGEHR